jgi:hypothetical protein
MNGDRIREVIARCNEILATSTDCAAEVDLYLGSISRHSDWTERDIMELYREIIMNFAHQLCEQR